MVVCKSSTALRYRLCYLLRKSGVKIDTHNKLVFIPWNSEIGPTQLRRIKRLVGETNFNVQYIFI